MKKTHEASCHCGAVRFQFEVDLDEPGKATRCNCSICMKTMVTGSILKPEAFTLLEGQEHLSEYAWGSRVATRYFCKHCSVLCFSKGYLEPLGGDFVSVNLNAIDDLDVNQLHVLHWDGRHDNWYVGPRPEPWPIESPVDANDRPEAGQAGVHPSPT